MTEMKHWPNGGEGEVNNKRTTPAFPVRLAMPVHFRDVSIPFSRWRNGEGKVSLLRLAQETLVFEKELLSIMRCCEGWAGEKSGLPRFHDYKALYSFWLESSAVFRAVSSKKTLFKLRDLRKD